MDFKLPPSHGSSSLTSLALQLQPLPPAASSSKTLLHRTHHQHEHEHEHHQQPQPQQNKQDGGTAAVHAGQQPSDEGGFNNTPRDLSSDEAALASSSSSSPPWPAALPISKVRGIATIATLSGVTFLNSMDSGILVSALPQIARDLGLSQGLILWPAAVYSLAAGCTLLIFGSIADVVGPRLMWLTGSFLFVCFTLGVGLAQTATQIITFRTLMGIAIAMCLPTTVSLITNTFPKGSWRNIAFSINGMGQPIGFALGLVLGGIFTDTIGWRWAYYLTAIINVCLSAVAIWSLPTVPVSKDRHWTTRLARDIDWVGGVIISAGLGMLLYVLAMTSASYRKLGDASTIAVLAISLVLLIAFPVWMELQVKRGKPALIPNKLWRNSAFTTVCIAVFLCWASLNALEYFMTLYFQEVQGLSAIQSSIRFLPHVIMGTCGNFATGFLISRVNVRILAVASALIVLVAPPLMATVPIGQSYWFQPFWALCISPLNADVLFTVSNLIISNAFPSELQSLAGGVFNEVTQFGTSVGLAITAAIAASVTEHEHSTGEPTEALMKGYRAAFWTIFASCVTVTAVVGFGLRKTGIVGKKDE